MAAVDGIDALWIGYFGPANSLEIPAALLLGGISMNTASSGASLPFVRSLRPQVTLGRDVPGNGD